MKTINKFALLAGLGLTLAGIPVQAQTDTSASVGDRRPPGPPHARFGQMLEGLINQYDANQDGQFDTTEMATLRQDIADGKLAPPGAPGVGPRGFGGPPAHVSTELLDKYDANKDGKLDATERATLHQDVQAGKTPAPGLGRGPRGPLGAPLSAAQILERFDTDKDGMLNEDELTAFLDSRPAPGLRHRGAGGPRFGNPPPEGDSEQQ